MIFKNIGFVIFLLCIFFMTSCQENMTTFDKEDVVTSRGRNETNNVEILSSKEFKDLAKIFEKRTKTTSAFAQEMTKMLDKMDKKERKSLLSRSIKQRKEFMEYMNSHHSEVKNDVDMQNIENKFFDEDVLKYRKDSKHIRQKHSGSFEKEFPKLVKALREKFPDLDNGDVRKLMNTLNKKPKR